MYIDLKKNNKTITNKDNNKIEQSIYQNEFIIDDCELYEDNINKIVSMSLREEDFDRYDGMSNKDIIENDLEVGEIDEQLTPDVKLNYFKGTTKEYIGVSIYHKEFDRFLKVGNIPNVEFDTLKTLMNKKVLIWGTYVGGKFKTANENNEITTYTKPVKIKILIKIFEE